jgi:hypothetical protein
MPKHLWDATDKIRTAFSTAKTARACYPGSHLTNAENCPAVRTALGRNAEEDWLYLPVGDNAASSMWFVLRQHADTKAVYIKMHACHAASSCLVIVLTGTAVTSNDHLLVRAISLVRNTNCLVSCWALLSQKAAHCMRHCTHNRQHRFRLLVTLLNCQFPFCFAWPHTARRGFHWKHQKTLWHKLHGIDRSNAWMQVWLHSVWHDWQMVWWCEAADWGA